MSNVNDCMIFHVEMLQLEETANLFRQIENFVANEITNAIK